MKKLINKLKLNNEGAAMVSVIIVAVFITILASTMLYFSGMNYKMKSVDYQNAKTFYKAEETLDVVKSILIKDVSDAYTIAYRDVMTNYDKYSDKATRKYACTQSFLNALSVLWSERVNGKTAGKEYEEAIIELIQNSDVKDSVKTEVMSHIYIDSTKPSVNISKIESEGKFILTNVKVSYSQNGYNSYIMTDIGLVMPDFEFIDGSELLYDPTKALDKRDALNLSDCVIYMNWKRY